MTLISEFPDAFKTVVPGELSAAFKEQWVKTNERFVKVEVAPVFVEDGDESFEYFARGDLARARELVKMRVLKQADLFADLASRGASNSRLRVVGRPVTPYIRDYERYAYEATATIGERTFVLPESDVPEAIARSVTDFLLFDTRAVIVHEYTPWGRLLAAYVSEDSAVVTEAAKIVDTLLPLSLPAADFTW